MHIYNKQGTLMIKPEQALEAPCTRQTPSGTSGDVSLFITFKIKCFCAMGNAIAGKMTPNFDVLPE